MKGTEREVTPNSCRSGGNIYEYAENKGLLLGYTEMGFHFDHIQLLVKEKPEGLSVFFPEVAASRTTDKPHTLNLTGTQTNALCPDAFHKKRGNLKRLL